MYHYYCFLSLSQRLAFDQLSRRIHSYGDEAFQEAELSLLGVDERRHQLFMRRTMQAIGESSDGGAQAKADAGGREGVQTVKKGLHATLPAGEKPLDGKDTQMTKGTRVVPEGSIVV